MCLVRNHIHLLLPFVAAFSNKKIIPHTVMGGVLQDLIPLSICHLFVCANNNNNKNNIATTVTAQQQTRNSNQTTTTMEY